MIKTKRIYKAPEKDDGIRILVDRLWPRGISKEKAKVDLWMKEIAPSAGLRKWYGHDPQKSGEFKRRYEAELAAKQNLLSQIALLEKAQPVTLLYSSKEGTCHNAAVLKDYLSKKAR
jgi:uncharacterized protein YeaO (DUF488 family)